MTEREVAHDDQTRYVDWHNEKITIEPINPTTDSIRERFDAMSMQARQPEQYYYEETEQPDPYTNIRKIFDKTGTTLAIEEVRDLPGGQGSEECITLLDPHTDHPSAISATIAPDGSQVIQVGFDEHYASYVPGEEDLLDWDNRFLVKRVKQSFALP